MRRRTGPIVLTVVMMMGAGVLPVLAQDEEKLGWSDTAELGFVALSEERFDFAVPKSRIGRQAVIAFCELLQADEVRASLAEMGFSLE